MLKSHDRIEMLLLFNFPLDEPSVTILLEDFLPVNSSRSWSEEDETSELWVVVDDFIEFWAF